tara:strand:+ start:116 stop:412 length:297 start_codon:yes stop_codon:yes gene_type:complete
MKLTKEALKQLIKEELEEVSMAHSEAEGDPGPAKGSTAQQSIEKAKQAFRDGDKAEDQILAKIIDMIGSAAKKNNLGTDSKLIRLLGMIQAHLESKEQ